MLALWQTEHFAFRWGKSYSIDTLLFPPASSSINFGTRLKNGSIAIIGRTDIPTLGGFSMDRALVMTLVDSSGNILWSNHLRIDGWCFTPVFVTETENAIRIICQSYTMNPLQSTDGVGIVAVDKATGNAIDEAQIYGISGELVLKGCSSNGQFISGYAFELSVGHSVGFVMKLSESGPPAVELSKAINSTSFPGGSIHCVTQVGSEGLVLGGMAMMPNLLGGFSSGQFFTAKTDTNLSVITWSMVYSETAQSGELEDVGVAYLCKTTSDNKFLFWGDFSGPAYAIKANPDSGRSSCLNIPIDVSLNEMSATHDTRPITVSSGVFSNPQEYVVADDISDDAPTSVITVCSD
jgi:hypothetical protein